MRSGAALGALLLVAGCARGGAPEPEAAPPPPAPAATSPRTCARLELTPLRVVRIDEPQHRLFVAGTDATGAQIAARIQDLETCFGFTEWAERWSLSVFTDAALARYKDDPQVADAVRDGRWARAYVAEYSAAAKTLTRNPGGPPEGDPHD